MRIVIVGDGQVGFALTEKLSKEGHNITVIDSRASALFETASMHDVQTVEGNGATVAVQRLAGVGRSDLLIAATSHDEINMLCCLIARKLGAKGTVARVKNPDYMEQLSLLKEELGLAMTINPDQYAAVEMAQVLRFPSAIKIDTFSRGKVELVEFKVREESSLKDLALKEMYKKYRVKVLVCAVLRHDNIYIPTGDFILRAGDNIYIAAPPMQITEFCKTVGLMRQRIRNVMIVGGGRIAYYLAHMLEESDIRVKIIEADGDYCMELNELLPKATIICGDGTNQDLLDEEGISSTDAFIAMTGIDEENIVLSLYAKALNVPKVITKVNRLSFLDVLGDTLGLDGVISPRSIVTSKIVSYVRGKQNSYGSGVETLHQIINGRAEAIEFKIRRTGSFLGVPLKDLRLKMGLLIACIIRNGQSILPDGNTTIEMDDSVIVVTTLEGLKDIRDILA